MFKKFKRKKEEKIQEVENDINEQNEGETLDDIDTEYEEKEEQHKTSWYEKTGNIVITTIIVLLFGAIFWRFQGDTVKGWFNIGTDYLVDEDVSGQLEEYRKGVEEEFTEVTKKEEKEDEGEVNLENSPTTLTEGEYVVGKDIWDGDYLVQSETEYSKYTDEIDVRSRRPYFTSHKETDAQGVDVTPIRHNKIDTLVKGDIIEVYSGKLVLDSTREKTDVKINESVILKTGNDYRVGIDVPAGYYKVVTTEYKKKGSFKINGANENIQPKSVRLDRQTYVKLGKGNIINSREDIILTRVDFGEIK